MGRAMSVSGDFTTIAQIEGRLLRLASRWSDRVNRAIEPRIMGLVADGFSQSRSPDGKTWAPTRSGGKPLIKTGALAGSISVTAGAGGIQVRAASPYAAFHQHGTRWITARPFLPEGKLPPLWAGLIRDDILRAIASVLL
jgi:phage gpG-like protein